MSGRQGVRRRTARREGSRNLSDPLPTIGAVNDLRVQWVTYGRPAAEALRSAVAAAKSDEPLRPVTVVVSSNHVGVASRRLLAAGRLGPVTGSGFGIAAVTFITPYRLAELLGAAALAGAGRRPVSTPVIGATVRAVLASPGGLFDPVADHPATEAALVEAYRELRDLSAGALEAIAANGKRAAEVVSIHHGVNGRLRPRWYDEQDLIDSAVAELRSGERTAVELGSVIVYLPQRLSRHSAHLLEAVAERTDMVIVAGTTGVARADAEVVTSVARIGSSAGPPSDRPVAVVGVDRTRFVTASDADDEVRAAVRSVIDAVRAGTPLDRIAVLHASPEPYARLVHEHLSAAGIELNGSAVAPLTASVAGRTLLRLLEMPAAHFRRQDVLAWLAAAPLLHDGRWTPTSAWERLSRKAGIVGGRHEWDSLLTTLAENLEARALELASDPEEPSWRVEKNRSEASRARDLRRFMLERIDSLAEVATGVVAWGELAEWAHTTLCDLIGSADRRGDWPEAERQAAERVEAAIDRLATLNAVEGPVSLDVFARTLELELESDLGRVGRFGNGVLVGPVGMGVGLDLDLLVVLGLAEGSFPAAVRDDSLLPDRERRAAGGELALRRQRVDREHRELLAALAGAGKQVLCLPRGDLRRSTEHVPSRWALELASSLAGRRWWSADLFCSTESWVEHVPSFDAGLRRVSFPATSQEHRLRALMAAGLQRRDVAALCATSDRVLAAGASMVGARRSPDFTRFDGHLIGSRPRSPAAGVTSATALERWASCPFGYFERDLLGVDKVDNPEESLMITPLDRGSLVHTILERFLVEVLSRPASEQPGPDEQWTVADRELMRAITDEVCADYEARGRTGQPIYWKRARLRIAGDTQRVLSDDDAYRAEHRTRPVAAELAFGSRREMATVALLLPDGRPVRFRGQADRVDVGEDGSIHVVDYKTGNAKHFKNLGVTDPDRRGTKLQLAVYGVAARHDQRRPEASVRAEYWFVSSGEAVNRIGYPVTDDVLARVGASLGAIVTGIEAGVFPSHPLDNSTSPFACPFCDPDGLGLVELRRQWDHKRADPAFAIYADFAEPVEPTDGLMADA